MSALLRLQCSTLLLLGENRQGKHKENLPSKSCLAQCQNAKPREDSQECATLSLLPASRNTLSEIENLAQWWYSQSFFFFFFLKKQQSHNSLNKTTSSAGTWRSLEGKEYQSYCTVSAVLKGDWAAESKECAARNSEKESGGTRCAMQKTGGSIFYQLE